MKTLSLCIPLLVSLASCAASSLPDSVGFGVKTLRIPRGGSLVSSAESSARHKQQRRQMSWPWQQQQQKNSSTKLQSSVSLSLPLQTNRSSRTASSHKPQLQLDAKPVSLALFSALGLYLLYSNRQVLLPLLTKDRIQQATLSLPSHCDHSGGLSVPQWFLKDIPVPSSFSGK